MDGGRIVYLLDTGKVSSLKFPTFWAENTPQGKFMLTIAAQASGSAAQPLKDKLAALEEKFDRLLDAHLDELISREEYARRK
ncbi:MAG: hypothetical protein VST64_09895, partial [Nitrospirota bacterium]|nr:hypothetical protein [Nitrospirota bacterium]